MEETAPNCMLENRADVVPYFACYGRRKLSRNWTALHLVPIPFGIRVEVSTAATDSGVRRSGRTHADTAFASTDGILFVFDSGKSVSFVPTFFLLRLAIADQLRFTSNMFHVSTSFNDAIIICHRQFRL